MGPRLFFALTLGLVPALLGGCSFTTEFDRSLIDASDAAADSGADSGAGEGGVDSGRDAATDSGTDATGAWSWN